MKKGKLVITVKRGQIHLGAKGRFTSLYLVFEADSSKEIRAILDVVEERERTIYEQEGLSAWENAVISRSSYMPDDPISAQILARYGKPNLWLYYTPGSNSGFLDQLLSQLAPGAKFADLERIDSVLEKEQYEKKQRTAARHRRDRQQTAGRFGVDTMYGPIDKR